MTTTPQLPAWRQYAGYTLATGLCLWSIRCLYALYAMHQAASRTAESFSSAGEATGSVVGTAMGIVLTAFVWAAIAGPVLVLWYFVRKPPVR